MIRLEKVHKYFSKGTAAEVHALNGLDLELKKGEFTIVLGANGSGKSTMLQLLAGALQPDEGTIVIHDKKVNTLPEHIRSRWVSRVFQNPLTGTCASLSVLENFRLAALRTSSKKIRAGTGSVFRDQVRERISKIGLGLENKLDLPMSTLSGGQRQALTLLMAVMDQSELLLMDEPTAALDPRTSGVIMQLADQLIRENGLTAILVTHHLKDAISFGERLILMSEGKIVKDVSGVHKSDLTLAGVGNWFG